MPAAAPVPVRKAVGKAQKTGIADRSPTAAIVIATISSSGDCAWAVKPAPTSVAAIR
jgi:hypothetical protein